MPNRNKILDDPSKRIFADKQITERTPTQVVDMLNRIINREAEVYDAITQHGTIPLPIDRVDDFAKIYALACKAKSEERLSANSNLVPDDPEDLSKLSNKQLMDAMKKT